MSAENKSPDGNIKNKKTLNFRNMEGNYNTFTS